MNLSKPSHQSLAIALAAGISYLWVANPNTQQHSLQFAAFLFLGFLVLQKIAKRRLTQLDSLTPNTISYQLAILAASLYLLLDSTGGISSIFLPLAYGLLFLAVLSISAYAVVTLAITIPLLLWAIMPTMPNMHDLVILLSFPALLPLLILAKEEHVKLQKNARELEHSKDIQQESMLFLTTFLRPKLEKLLELSQYPEHNQVILQRQILLVLEATKDLIEDQSSMKDQDDYKTPQTTQGKE